jgi:NAD(P)-dependent dehydrogenase (short-subunit alcohol dehydrogenase family)
LKAKYASLPVTFLQCDLSSLESIRKVAEQFTSDRLDIFIGNAGIMSTETAMTGDGYEQQFGTNHVGHAALLKLLMPKILSTAEGQPAGSVRVVLVTSAGYALHPKGGIQFDKLKTDCADIGGLMGAGWTCYGQSKTANILYAAELARKYPKVVFASVHPGVVETDMFKAMSLGMRIFTRIAQFGKVMTPEQGAWNSLWASTAEKGKGLESGVYYIPVGVEGKLDADAGNVELAGKLWEWTEKELDGFGKGA